MSVRILTGDCRDVLRTLPNESVHCIVTSPPYYGLRDYQVAGQIGLEETPDAYVKELVAIFGECRRVLRGSGTFFLNLGDSYASTTSTTSATGARGGSFASERAQWQGAATRQEIPHGLKPKDLIGIPWLVAFALRADGWYLRQDIIWSKPNPMPESVTDRCTKAHEYIFLLSKSARYYYDAEIIKESVDPKLEDSHYKYYRGVGTTVAKTNIDRNDQVAGERFGAKSTARFSNTRNKRSVWEIATHPYAEAHFATFPPALIEPCIKAGCPEFTCGSCGTALDSRYGKSGSSTVGKAVQDLQMVRREGGAGTSEPSAQLLQQGLCLAMGGEKPEHYEGIHDHDQGLSDAPSARTSERDSLRLRDGTPLSGRDGDWPTASPHRGRSPQGRRQAKQQDGQLGSSDKEASRQTSEASDRNDSLSALRREDHALALCPSCGASLDKVGVNPGVVLDCFGGAGTTGLVADRLGRNSILIELNPDYAVMAEKRIHGDAPLFVEVAAA